MYRMDLALNNLQYLICHKTKLNQTSQGPIYGSNKTVESFSQGYYN